MKSLSVKHSRMISTLPPAAVKAFFAKKSATIQPIDATWYLPNVPMSGYHEFMKRRLTSKAVFFDISAVKDSSKPYPHMLPSAEDFARAVSELGIKNDDDLVIYDQQGIFSACRAGWLFEVFGHDLNKITYFNTFPAYAQSNADPNLVMKLHTANNLVDESLATSPSSLPKSDYKATLDPRKVVLYEDLLELVQTGKIGTEYTLVDARGATRFTGEAEEVRPGMSSGHIPGSINIPYTELLTPQKAFLSSVSLKSIFQDKGIDPSKPVIVSCGSGVTACVVRAALQLAGFDSSKVAVYDGSWCEWSQRAPKELIVKGN